MLYLNFFKGVDGKFFLIDLLDYHMIRPIEHQFHCSLGAHEHRRTWGKYA